MSKETIESTWSEEDLQSWSDSKLEANIKACELNVEIGTGDDGLDWEHNCAFVQLLIERDRRRELNNNDKIAHSEQND